MESRTLLAAGALLYAAASVFLVHHQAESYRDGLRRRRALATAEPRPVEPPRPPAPAVGPTPQPVPTPVRPAAAGGNSTASNTPTPEPSVPTEKPVPPAEDVAAPRRSATPRPPALVIPDLEHLTPAEEARLGKLLHELVLANHPADDDSPFRQAIADAARPLFALRARKDVEPTVTVLDSDEVNAFSHLGGYIYVTRGLFHLAGTEEEYRFVVGHELAHVELRHAEALVDEATRLGKLAGVGTLQALYHQIAAGYTEAQEREADDWVIARMVRLDHSKRECLAFLRKLAGHSDRLGFRNGRKPPKTDPTAAVQDVANAIRSQPAAWSRIERIETRFKASPGAGRSAAGDRPG